MRTRLDQATQSAACGLPRLAPSLLPVSFPPSSCTTSYASRGLFPTSAKVPAAVWPGYAVQLRSIRRGDSAGRVLWPTGRPLQRECKFDKAWNRPLLSKIRPLTPWSRLCSAQCARFGHLQVCMIVIEIHDQSKQRIVGVLDLEDSVT